MKAARIVVLGVALAAGGVAALLVGRSGEPPPPPPAPVVQLETVEVLVAKNEIAPGHALGADDLRWETWPAASAGSHFVRRSDRPNAIPELTGWVARAPVAAGEPIRVAKLVNVKGSGFMAAVLPTGKRAMSTEINPEIGVAGFILPNDHVDVIITKRDRAAEKAKGYEVQVSETLLSNLRVLAIDQTVEEKGGQKVVVGKTATLEVTPRQAEVLAVARQTGTLSLVLRSIGDINPGSSEPAADDKGGPNTTVNLVRFGIAITTAK
jgi:pilus assembly protein CpaB